MSTLLPRLALGLGLGLSLAAGLAPAQDAHRSVDQLLKEIDEVKPPTVDPAKVNDQAYRESYIKAMRETAGKRASLILELYKAAPDHERVPDLITQRWQSLPMLGKSMEELSKEIDETLATTKSDKLKTEGLFFKAQVGMAQAMRPGGGGPDAALKAIDAFVSAAPKDRRAPQLLYTATRIVRTPEQKAALEDRLLKEFPDSPVVAAIQGARKQREAVGKPFELDFTEAIKGTTISMKDLKGKVVVVDFWATWCGPCVAEMPKMKDLYAKYKDQGVEFIGVSLDQPEDEGGLTKLKEFVKEREIAWPQYYQGKGWESEFSRGWGINSIPAVFIVDAEGKLYSTEARGKLEELIPELLEKRDKGNAGGQ